VYETLDPVRNYKQQIGEKLLCDTFFCMEDFTLGYVFLIVN